MPDVTREVKAVIALYHQLLKAQKTALKQVKNEREIIANQANLWKEFLKSRKSGLADKMMTFAKSDITKQEKAIPVIRAVCADYQRDLNNVIKDIKKEGEGKLCLVGHKAAYALEDALDDTIKNIDDFKNSKTDNARKQIAKAIADSGKTWSKTKSNIENELNTSIKRAIGWIPNYPHAPLDKSINDLGKIVSGNHLVRLDELANDNTSKSKKTCIDIVEKLIDCCDEVIKNVVSMTCFIDPKFEAEQTVEYLKTLRRNFDA